MVWEAVVAHRWHPWRGRGARVHEATARGAGTVARRSLGADLPQRVQELPSWMLGAATCRAMRGVARPEASMPALGALAALGALGALGARLVEALARSGAAAEAFRGRTGRLGRSPRRRHAAPTPPPRRRHVAATPPPRRRLPDPQLERLAEATRPPPGAPCWATRPEPGRRALTALVTRLLIAHAAGAPAPQDGDAL